MATRNWDILGMSRRQQINLATHETRLWLEVIRDKALAGFEASSQRYGTHRYKRQPGDELPGSRELFHDHTIRTQPPKSGFLAIALAAVLKAGLLGGAGQQWQAGGAVQQSHRFARGARRKPARSAKSPLPTSKKRLLKKKSAPFTPLNGKCNGHKVYTKVHKAQVGENRVASHFENAYSLPPSRLRAAPRRAGKKGTVTQRR
jgi:hypothetical protein